MFYVWVLADKRSVVRTGLVVLLGASYRRVNHVAAQGARFLYT